ncbi:MAG: hypothetical protein LBE62_11560 [Azonexus sp.]|jgi:hypothetical protein|nr:hypothetical protein [Azonexus sp.]
MGILTSLFSGVKALVREVVGVVAEGVRAVLEEIDKSSFGRAATQLVQGITKRYFGEAEELAEAERELGEKYRHDRKRTPADDDRLREIAARRNALRKDIAAAKSNEAAAELRKNEKSVIAVPPGHDEISATVGILASKVCPECGAPMTMRQGGVVSKTNKPNLYWQCTSLPRPFCRTITFNPEKEKDVASLIRMPDPNLDLSERRAIWERPDVLKETSERVFDNLLGQIDPDVICPHHLLPMKLLEKPNADGRLLTSYEYVCRWIDANGKRCQHRVALETFPQVSETLKRHEGVGIIR